MKEKKTLKDKLLDNAGEIIVGASIIGVAVGGVVIGYKFGVFNSKTNCSEDLVPREALYNAFEKALKDDFDIYLKDTPVRLSYGSGAGKKFVDDVLKHL